MIDLGTVLKLAAPVVGALISNEITSNTNPKKQENVYAEIVPTTISTIAKAIMDSDEDKPEVITTPQVSPINMSLPMNPPASSPYEMAKNKEYKYNF